MHFNIYGVYYSQSSHQHFSATVVAILMVILLQKYSGTDVFVLSSLHNNKSYFHFT